MNSKVPFYSFGALGLFVVALVIILIFGDTNNTEVILFIGTLLANVPGLVASFMAEKNNAAIHNGVVQEKAKQGAIQALQETDVMTRTGPVVSAQLEALTQLLENTKSAMQTNTNATQENTSAHLGAQNGPTV